MAGLLKKTWVRVVLVLALIVIGVVVKRVWFTPPPKPQVVTAPVALADLEDTVLATGTIGAAKLVSVGARVTGELKRLHVALGDKVKQGQLVAEIDALTQQNELRNAEAALQSARALLRSKQAQLKQAELAATRLRELVAIDAGARADLEAAEATLGTTRADIASQEALIDQAKSTADSARVNIGYTRVVAPMDGTVVAVVTEQGQTVNANQSAPTIIKLAKLDTMTVKAQISEADVPRVKAGMPVYFSLLGEPDQRIETTLLSVEPGPTTLATETTTGTSSSTSSSTSTSSAVYYNGIFDVPNPDGKLRISMTAQTNIVLARAKQVLAVPSAALGAHQAGTDRYEVKVLEGTQVVKKNVRIGMNNRVQAQVLEGLNAGEQVVVSEAAAGGASGGPRRGGPF
jgi:membrane fusion protein, macrolide-specific efflux system